MGNPEVEELIGRLDDPWKPTRNEAAQLLADLGPAVVPPLRDRLLSDQPDPDHAQYFVWVLEQVDTPEAEATLEAYWARHG